MSIESGGLCLPSPSGVSRLCAKSCVAGLRRGREHGLMALLSSNLRNVVPPTLSLRNSSSKTSRTSTTSSGSRNSRINSGRTSPLQCVRVSAAAQCCSFCGTSLSAGPGGCSLPSAAKFGLLAQLSPRILSTKRTAIRSAEDVVGMALPAGNCSSELEPVLGQVSFPAGVFGGLKGSLVTTAGGLLGSAGKLGGGNIQGGVGGGGSEVGEGKVGAVKDLLRLGCALVTPGVGAASASGDWWSQFVPGMQDVFACAVTLAGAFAFLQIFNELAKRNVLEKKLSRKLVHIAGGLLFMLFWPLFTTSRIAPYLAAFAAPVCTSLRLLLIGLGLMKNDAVVRSITREGDRRELLKGPVYYGLAVVITTIGFWRTSPVGIVAIVNLCAGDGFADIIGRNFGRTKLPYNHEKSIAGSVGFFIMASLVSILYLSYFAAFGLLKILPGTFLGVVLVSLFTAAVESLPISSRIDDNFTVPLAAIFMGMLILPVS